jgi:tyrosyl-tRNA synthetase
MDKSNVIDVLKARGFIDAETSEELRLLAANPMKVYCGFDPTADSLHLGNLVGIIGLGWFQRFGHTPVALVGGATGMIGDPSGKTSERQLLTEEILTKNVAAIHRTLSGILNQGPTPPLVLNNLDWFKNFSFIGFLRDVGKFFRLGPMLAKESVKARFESEEGMSFTEFSYQLLQGYDFLYLYQNLGVQLQIGGSDQWGNITAGVELTRKMIGKTVYGMTFPLLVKSDGQKFGKSEKGAVWLSPDKLSPYEFYQHLFRTSDADVIACLKLLTYLPMEEILGWERKMKESACPPNIVQKVLAEEVTRFVHGKEGLELALNATKAASPGSTTVLDVQTLESIAKDIPTMGFTEVDLIGKELIEVIVKAGMLPSKSEARKMIKNGGVYLNNQQVESPAALITSGDLIENKILMLAIGKKNKMLVRVI